ncbi:MAG: hypothetical protein B9S32_02875 [Verrucomicrobia bacterium Tous-C9LFEB]|nr:MAG: hypothetical protein B9S32_02875 [Verrucomicrobia bacterium Tous-C9LFEB]
MPSLSSVLGAVLIFGFGCSVALAVSSSFETTDGPYVNGSSIGGKTDSSIGGSWSSVSGAVSSNVNVLDGSLAIRATDTSTSTSAGGTMSWTNAASLMTSPFTFQFSLAIASDYSVGTTNQVQVYLGQAQAGDFNHWASVYFDEGNFKMATGNGTTDSWVGLGSYTTYSNYGEYVTFSLTIDPTTKKFTNVTVDGTKTAVPSSFTTAVQASNGGTIPWNSASGTPSNQMLLITGGNDTVTVDFDAFSITSAVPEPSAWALLLLASALLPLRRRFKFV